MLKKFTVLFLALTLLLTGCQSSRRIETAAVIENVSVHRENGRLIYTFYPLTDSRDPKAIAIPAASFEEAKELGERQYIPNMTLAKLELLLIHSDVCGDAMRRDIDYISTQSSFSPVAYVALCDSGTLSMLRHDSSVQQEVKRQIDLCRQENRDVKYCYLSVYNSYARGNGNGFSVPLLTAEDELRVGTQKVF